MSKEANNYTTKSNSTPLPTGKGVRLIISGGGTGGHIFPAISIANAIKELCPDAEILFVGAEGRMEAIFSMSSCVSGWNTIISSTRFKNSGRNAFFNSPITSALILS